MADPNDKSLARSLGEFFGHIFHGVKTDPSKRVVRTDVTTEERQTPRGKVVLRRTTVEEIELRPGEAGSAGGSADHTEPGTTGST